MLLVRAGVDAKGPVQVVTYEWEELEVALALPRVPPTPPGRSPEFRGQRKPRTALGVAPKDKIRKGSG